MLKGSDSTGIPKGSILKVYPAYEKMMKILHQRYLSEGVSISPIQYFFNKNAGDLEKSKRLILFTKKDEGDGKYYFTVNDAIAPLELKTEVRDLLKSKRE
jgi:hypothetical protein